MAPVSHTGVPARAILFFAVSFAYNTNLSGNRHTGIQGNYSRLGMHPAKTVMLCEVTAQGFDPALQDAQAAGKDLSTVSMKPVTRARECRAARMAPRRPTAHQGMAVVFEASGQFFLLPAACDRLYGPFPGGARPTSRRGRARFTCPRRAVTAAALTFLFCDGHVKWLRGDQVSTGPILGSASPTGGPAEKPTDHSGQQPY